MIFIYAGRGVSRHSLAHTQELFSEPTHTLTARELIETPWEKKAHLLVMPGDADLPYVRALSGRGTDKIKQFVSSGGNYLGICAGGYFGGAFVEFGVGTELEVVGQRDLAFFPGIVQGPTFPGFCYRSHKGSRLVSILQEGSQEELPLFFHGGCHFVGEADVLARYEENALAAIIHCEVGKGQAILSGVHFEYAADKLDPADEHLKELIPPLAQVEARRMALCDAIKEQLGVR